MEVVIQEPASWPLPPPAHPPASGGPHSLFETGLNHPENNKAGLEAWFACCSLQRAAGGHRGDGVGVGGLRPSPTLN